MEGHQASSVHSVCVITQSGYLLDCYRQHPLLKLNALLGPVTGELVERLRSARTWTDQFLESKAFSMA